MKTLSTHHVTKTGDLSLLLLSLPLYSWTKRCSSRLLLWLMAFHVLSFTLPVYAQPNDHLYVPPSLTLSVGDGSPWYHALVYGADPAKMNYGNMGEQEIRITASTTHAFLQLLPMIFFDQGSAAFQPAYQVFTRRSQGEEYREDAPLLWSPDVTDKTKYYEILNILGSRLSRDTTIHLQLLGGYSSEAGEKSEVGWERGMAVRHYFRDIWKVDTSRVAILPPEQMASITDNLMVQEDARRVIVLSDNRALFDPVEYQVLTVGFRLVALSFEINPNLEPERITGMGITLRNGRDVVGSGTVPVSPDSSIYHVVALWVVPGSLQMEQPVLTAEVLLQVEDGTTRLSMPVSLPVVLESVDGGKNSFNPRRESTESQYQPLRQQPFAGIIPISYYDGGDSLLHQWQFPFLTEGIDSLLAHRSDEAYQQFQPGRYILWPRVDYSEIPGLDPAAVAGIVAQKAPASFSFEREQKRNSEFPLLVLPPLSSNNQGQSVPNRELQKERDIEMMKRLFGETNYGQPPDRSSYPEQYGLAPDEEQALRTMLDARYHHLKELLYSRLPAESIDSISFSRHVSMIQRSTTGSSDDLHPSIRILRTPAERMYERMVLISLAPRDPSADTTGIGAMMNGKRQIEKR